MTETTQQICVRVCYAITNDFLILCKIETSKVHTYQFW